MDVSSSAGVANTIGDSELWMDACVVDGIGELCCVRLIDTSAGIAGSVEPDNPIDELL